MDTFYPAEPHAFAVFLFATVILGGAASWATGRAVALTWKPLWQLVFYMGLMTLAVRFIHYALFHEVFLSLQHVGVDFVVLAAIAWLGYRQTRSTQMQSQYPWLFRRTGLISWQRRS
ncbi:hypothetical protein SAMN04488061_2695 [Filomicrobium insigne]|uniref:DUF6867 domain-containing protein n=1 Tax=Filomicrobium insigne TaxID=418854 RepID=A0A1H0RDQ1_9HYPH|nr:hypothetical protein [Filomicrobium insigne]SDP27667.1 hypothetical protein SAMN04488061_2695 [Filomicrobium insigne]